MDKPLAQSLEQRGFVSFGFSDGGFAHMMSSMPLRKVDDLKSQKVWIPEGDDISRTLFETLGVSPVPLPLTDVLTGLQTGLVTTIASPAVGAITLQWHSRVKYLVDTPTVFTFGSLAIDKKAFSKVSPADQTVVRSVMEKIFVEFNRRNRLDDQGARQALKKQGIEFITLPPDEMTKLHRAAQDTNNKLVQKKIFNAATLRAVQEHLETYRRKSPAPR
jgi:TRAP-type C4-dicarboxylate transport system substrate-binding protein